jgi:hypothetical protein
MKPEVVPATRQTNARCRNHQDPHSETVATWWADDPKKCGAVLDQALENACEALIDAVVNPFASPLSRGSRFEQAQVH